MRSRMNSLAVVVACSVCLASSSKSIAQENQSTATVINNKGESFTIRSFTFSDSAETIKLNVPTVTFICGQFQGKPMPKEAKRIIPLVSVKTLTVAKAGDYNIPGEARIIMQSGSTSTAQCGIFSIKGIQDLGELGSGDFSIGSEMKEVTFLWNPSSSSDSTGLWPTKTSKTYRGTVTIGAATFTFDRMALYYQTSGSSCSIHSFCTFCNMRSSWTTGNIANTIKINKSNTDVQLELSKIRRIDFVNYPDVSVTLASGTKTDCKLLLEGHTQGVLAKDSEGWIFVPRELIKSIELE